MERFHFKVTSQKYGDAIVSVDVSNRDAARINGVGPFFHIVEIPFAEVGELEAIYNRVELKVLEAFARQKQIFDVNLCDIEMSFDYPEEVLEKCKK